MKKAWDAWKETSHLRVEESMPILFFGDLEAYRCSDKRIVTVGLNPSSHEFPECDPFLRFPNLRDPCSRRQPEPYLKALSAYFQNHPYRRWFSAYEHVLGGCEASYCSPKRTALHTDLCSPVATSRTWGDLNKNEKQLLKKCGVRLWRELLKALHPHIVLLSVAGEHLKDIECAGGADWKIIRTFHRKKDGTRRKAPYYVCARRGDATEKSPLFVFGQAANTPFGTLDNCRKHQVGATALKWAPP